MRESQGAAEEHGEEGGREPRAGKERRTWPHVSPGSSETHGHSKEAEQQLRRRMGELRQAKLASEG